MSFEMNNFTVVKKKRLEKSQFNVECNIDANAQIDKILSICHNAQVESAEILNGVVNFSGLLDICLLYSTPDGEIGTVSSSCPFTSKFEDQNIQVGDKVGIKVEVEDCKVDSVSNSSVKLSCQCEQSGVLIMCRDVQNVSSGDDSICVKDDEILVNTFVGEAKETFVVESEVSIKEQIRKILFTDSQVAIKSVESGSNFVSVGGEVITRILYLTENDRFEASYVTESFKEEVELEGVTRESISDAEAVVKRNSVKCEVEELEKGVNIKLTIPVEVKVCAYDERSERVIKDLYSTEKVLQISTESFDMTKTLSYDTFEAKIDGSLSLDAEKPRVDKIMFVGATNLCVTNSYLKNGEVYVEGITKTNVVYLNDETNSLHSVLIEVPFVVSERANVPCENAQVDVCAIIYDVDVVVKKGRDFYFDAKLKIKASFDCDVVSAVISGVQEQESLEEKDCAIEVTFAKSGQTAWDIAKGLGVREELIYLQNPEVVFPLEKDENIIIYYQKRG